MTNKPHSKNLRKGRVSLTGQIYSITTVCKVRKPFFKDFATARILINALKAEQELKHATTICFVIMPNHLHWLLQLEENKGLSNILRTVKSLTSKRAGIPLWQKGFYDHALRREENIKNVARYIVANPLRAGLVTNINDYSHWDAMWM